MINKNKTNFFEHFLVEKIICFTKTFEFQNDIEIHYKLNSYLYQKII